MKRILYIAAIAAFCWACNDPSRNPDKPRDPENPSSLWVMENDPVETIEVFVGKTLIETFSFEYDDLNRVTRLTRKDETTASIISDLNYSYDGELDMILSGSFTSSARGTIRASVDEDDWNMTVKGDWEDAIETRVAMDEDMPMKTEWTYGFDAKGGEYSSVVGNERKFKEKDGDIISVLETTSYKTGTSLATSGNSASSLETSYTYSEDEDLQNFGVFLMSCDFPVWYAKELPGCAHLITGMTMKCGNVVLPESFTVSYELNDNGSIKVATRSDYSRGRLVVERRYVFSYL